MWENGTVSEIWVGFRVMDSQRSLQKVQSSRMSFISFWIIFANIWMVPLVPMSTFSWLWTAINQELVGRDLRKPWRRELKLCNLQHILLTFRTAPTSFKYFGKWLVYVGISFFNWCSATLARCLVRILWHKLECANWRRTLLGSHSGGWDRLLFRYKY